MENNFSQLHDFKIISRFLNGELDAEESQLLLDWVNESDTNRKLFSEIKNYWVLPWTRLLQLQKRN
jgi:hypothetical protein